MLWAASTARAHRTCSFLSSQDSCVFRNCPARREDSDCGRAEARLHGGGQLPVDEQGAAGIALLLPRGPSPASTPASLNPHQRCSRAPVLPDRCPIGSEIASTRKCVFHPWKITKQTKIRGHGSAKLAPTIHLGMSQVIVFVLISRVYFFPQNFPS